MVFVDRAMVPAVQEGMRNGMPQQLNLAGQTKEEIAIEFIGHHEPPEGYFLGFSGGKDSVVLYDLTLKSGVKFQAYYSATGIDPPEVVKFIRDHYPDVIFKRPKSSFYAALQIKGFPMRFSRWCCKYFKKDPLKGLGRDWLIGVRAEESSIRAKRGQINQFDKNKINYHPIFSWLEWEIWDYIESNNLPHCSLYDEGFKRLGCVVCPFLCHGIKGDLKRNMDRWPKHYRAFEKAMKKLFDHYLCAINPRSGAWNYRRETDFDEFLLNWYRGK